MYFLYLRKQIFYYKEKTLVYIQYIANLKDSKYSYLENLYLLQRLEVLLINHKPEQEMFIGISTKTLINKLFEKGDISTAEKQQFYSAVHFILKHSLTQFKNFLSMTLF